MPSTRKIKTKLLKLLPETGVLILFSSLFLNWFSCPVRPDLKKNISYFLASYRSDPYAGGLAFYPACLALYLISLAVATHFLKRLDLKIFFLLFSLFLFLQLTVMVWAEKEFGYHNTIDFPCYPNLGFWMHIIGLAVVTIGSYSRLRKHA